MELLENVRDIFTDNENDTSWWCLKIIQNNVPSDNIMKGVFRKVISSNYSVAGIKSFDLFKRWIYGGVHISFTNGNTGIIMMFFKGTKKMENDGHNALARQFLVRYYKSVKLTAPKLALFQIKPSESMTTYQLINEYLNRTLDDIFESEAGDIPKIHMRKFGCYSKSSKSYQK